MAITEKFLTGVVNQIINTLKAMKGEKGDTGNPLSPRIYSVVSDAEPIINTDAYDVIKITALATDITSMTTNLSGTPLDYQKLFIEIKDDGTQRSITWGASFAEVGITLPVNTTAGKKLIIGFKYNAVSAIWEGIAYVKET